jgi:hypothetical protein
MQINDQERLVIELYSAPSAAAIGATIAYLLHCQKVNPIGLKAALNAPMKHDEVGGGRQAYSLIEVLKAAAR